MLEGIKFCLIMHRCASQRGKGVQPPWIGFDQGFKQAIMSVIVCQINRNNKPSN